MRTDDGFDIEILEDTLLADELYMLRVRKVMKYGETIVLHKDELSVESLAQEIADMKNRIDARINCGN